MRIQGTSAFAPALVAAAALVVAAALAAAAALPARAAMPKPGSLAPPVPVLQSVIGGSYEPFDLSAASSSKAVVLYFFPEAFTAD